MNQPEDTNAEFNRRNFLKGGSLATVLTMLGGVPIFAQTNETATPEPKKLVGPKVKVGVIGLGPWGREILAELGRLEQAEITVICDNYPAMLRRSASKAPTAKAVENYKDVLANKDVQAVVVATPTHQHKEIVLAALEAGKHVYCEAPLANSIEDAKAIALAAKKAAGQVCQAGLQMRCDPQRHWLMPFIRSGALGRPVMARSQSHKKNSWRQESSNEERAKAINWRLHKATSLGLVGEVGLHFIDQAGWFFLNQLPVAVTGFGSNIANQDGRDVADTVHLIVEYPGGVRLAHDITLANSYEGEFEVYYGGDAAVLIRDLPTQAWMFKEVTAALGGWEVYARRDTFVHGTGIALVAGGSKQKNLSAGAASQSAFPLPPLNYALEAFLMNCGEVSSAIADYADSGFDATDKAALAQYLAGIQRPPIPADTPDSTRALYNMQANIPKFDVGYAATVFAIKANEAIASGARIELKKEWFELT